MRRRTGALMAAVGCVVILWASPAAAKGPDQATITGPGLDEPVVVTGYGESGSGYQLGELADGSGFFVVVFEPLDRRVTGEAPTEQLGAKYEIVYRVPDGAGGATIRQELYPLAAGGPVTYTEPGQEIFGMKTRGGWFRSPSSFSDLLEVIGVPATAGELPPAAPAAAPEAADTATAATPQPPVVAAILAAAIVVVAGVLLGRWRMRSRALPRRS